MSDLDRMRSDMDAFDKELRSKLGGVVKQVIDKADTSVRTRHTWQARTGATDAAVSKSFGASGTGEHGQVFVDSEVAIMLNDGTPAHEILPKNRTVLRFEVGGETRFARRVQHPGTSATRYLDNAADEVEATIDALTEAAIDSALNG